MMMHGLANFKMYCWCSSTVLVKFGCDLDSWTAHTVIIGFSIRRLVLKQY